MKGDEKWKLAGASSERFVVGGKGEGGKVAQERILCIKLKYEVRYRGGMKAARVQIYMARR